MLGLPLNIMATVVGAWPLFMVLLGLLRRRIYPREPARLRRNQRSKDSFRHEVAMILRSPTENENGGLSFHRVPSSTRHSRARGNPGLLRRISLDTRFRGYDGTQAGLFVLIPKRVFSKEITKDTKVFVGCASRTGRSRNVSRKDVKAQRKSIVISNEERNLS